MPLKPKVQPPSETSSETRPTCKIFISFRPLISLKRLNTPLPVYKTTFAFTGSVGGKTFTSSSSTLTNRRSAEQDAAKLLHYNIYSMRIHLMLQTGPSHRDRGLSASPIFLKNLVCQEKTRCKMILNEFIDKIEVEFVYETVQVEMAHVFVSSLVLNGTCYKGECGKNKKEDEQLAALSAILSLLDDPIYGTQISEVLNSKFSACAVFKDCSVTSNEFKATTSNGEQGSSGILVRKKKQDLVNSLPQIENKVNKTSLPQTEKQGGPGVLLDDTQCVSGHLPGAVTISRSSYVPLPITSAETISRCSYVNMPRTSPLVSEPQQEKSSFKRQLNQLLSKSVSLFLLQQQHTIRVMIRSFLERDEERTRRRQTRDCELRTTYEFRRLMSYCVLLYFNFTRGRAPRKRGLFGKAEGRRWWN
ncbi:hypothetical protein F2Q69_00045386 [Brassica cretica]|uniref:DRBM domain-containing protein n=1 Tax=Brassica cretica TaxID=69181 RepID=A0A8S9NUQ4_BRACR|nr:hypothetical protein F2Q69_00045386 [Brassica cretica]